MFIVQQFQGSQLTPLRSVVQPAAAQGRRAAARSDARPRCARPLLTRGGKERGGKDTSVVKSCTFSLRSPPPSPLQLAFDLSALSPRRAAVVSKYGCHQRSLWSEAQLGLGGSTLLVSALRLITQRPRLLRRLCFGLCSFIPLNLGGACRFYITSETPARLPPCRSSQQL